MPFTEYKYSPEWAEQKIAEYKTNLKANRGTDDLLAVGLGVICDRLDADPRRYRDYGPYWWSLKKLIAKYTAARVAGSLSMDETMANEYKGETDEQTLVMAEGFRDDYLATFFLYTNEFMLDADDPDNSWRLYDSDYENLYMVMTML